LLIRALLDSNAGTDGRFSLYTNGLGPNRQP
jgi:hypothetical protein